MAVSEDSPLLGGSPKPPDSLRRVLLGVALFVTAVAMTIPVRPRLILDASKNNATFASYYTGVLEVTQAVLEALCSPVLGALSDVLGRKPVLVVSQVGELVALLVVAKFRTNLTVQFFAYLLIALTSAYTTTTNTILADISSDGSANATTNYGLLGATIGLCFMVGPTVGGYIDETLYRAASFHVAALIIFASLFYVFFLVPETRPPQELDTRPMRQRFGNAVRNAQINPFPRVRRVLFQSEFLAWLAMAIAVSALAQTGMIAVLFLYVNTRLGWSTKETGIFISATGLGLLIAQGALARVAVKVFGEENTIVIGYTLAATHFLIYGIARNTLTMFIGLFVGVFSFISGPAVKSVLARQAPASSQGELQGSMTALSSLVKPISTILATTLFGVGNSINRPGMVFFVISAISYVAVILTKIAFSKPGIK